MQQQTGVDHVAVVPDIRDQGGQLVSLDIADVHFDDNNRCIGSAIPNDGDLGHWPKFFQGYLYSVFRHLRKHAGEHDLFHHQIQCWKGFMVHHLTEPQ